MWVANYRLPTRQRLFSWGLQISPLCCLCSTFEESRDHLFLRCEFNQALWHLVIQKLGMSPFTFHTWTAMLEWSSVCSVSIPSLLRRLASQTVIYLIWNERNQRLHNQIATTTEHVMRVLDRSIKDTILARRQRKGFRNLMHKWMRN